MNYGAVFDAQKIEHLCRKPLKVASIRGLIREYAEISAEDHFNTMEFH